MANIGLCLCWRIKIKRYIYQMKFNVLYLKGIGFILILLLLLSSFSFETKEKVKIFVAWPGAAYLPAYEWILGEDKPRGIEPNLIEHILNEAGYSYVFVNDYDYQKDGDVRIDVILDGVADISIRSISITEERKQKVNFSIPYYYDGISAITLLESEINSIADFDDKIIYATDFTTAYTWAKENLKNATIVSEGDFPFFVAPENRLLLGQIDVYLADRSFLIQLTKENTYFKVLEEKYTEEPFAIAVDKNKTQLLKDINAAIEQLIDSGEMQKLIKDFDN